VEIRSRNGYTCSLLGEDVRGKERHSALISHIHLNYYLIYTLSDIQYVCRLGEIQTQCTEEAFETE